MSLPTIGQARMLADEFELLIERESPGSVAIVGCAGGNGLERIAPGKVRRVVAVDINPRYVEETGRRHAGRLAGLELICADVQSAELRFEPVDLVYAALIFEYVDAAWTLATLQRNCKAGGTLAILLQLHDRGQQAVSPSPYRSLSSLAPVLRLVSPPELASKAAAAGFVAAESRTIAPDSGKRFQLQTFRRA